MSAVISGAINQAPPDLTEQQAAAEKAWQTLRAKAATKGLVAHKTRDSGVEIIIVTMGSWCREFGDRIAAEVFIDTVPDGRGGRRDA